VQQFSDIFAIINKQMHRLYYRGTVSGSFLSKLIMIKQISIDITLLVYPLKPMAVVWVGVKSTIFLQYYLYLSLFCIIILGDSLSTNVRFIYTYHKFPITFVDKFEKYHWSTFGALRCESWP